MYYNDRMFENWQIGVMHLLIVVALPILPILVYIETENNQTRYLCTLVLSVAIPFLFDNIKPTNKKVGRSLLIERVVASIALSVIIVWSLYNVFFIEADNTPFSLKTADKIILSLFFVIAIIVIIEIGKCIWDELKALKKDSCNDIQNSMKGAEDV